MKGNDHEYKQVFWGGLLITCEFCSDEEYKNKETPFHKAIKRFFPKFMPICNSLQDKKKKYFVIIYNKLKTNGFITDQGLCRIH